jgi:hypothetical protein
MTIYAGDAPTLNSRTLLDLPADSGEVASAAFDAAFSTNPTNSLLRMEEVNEQEQGRALVMGPESYLAPNAGRAEPESPLLEAQQARDRVAAAGFDIKIPDQGIRQGALDVLIQRQREQVARQQVMARAAGGTMPAQIAASLGASLLDPLNIASAFVPVVGEARYVAMLGRATSPLARAGVRAGVGAAEGVVGAAIIEPLPLLAAQQDQTEYGLSDSLANIALGGVLGGGLHAFGGAISDALRKSVVAEQPTARADAPTAGPAPAVSTPARYASADFGRLFEQDPESALRASLARGLEADQVNLARTAERQAIDEIRPSLAGERVGNVADLKLESLDLTSRDMALDDSYRDRAKAFQEQRMTRKQAERAARDSIAAEREQIRGRQAEINTQLERNRAGEFDRRDLSLLDKGQIPERLKPQIEARARQIAQGYAQRPLGVQMQTARQTAEQAHWTTREHALRTAVAQAMSGRDIDVQHLFDLEDAAKAPAALENMRRPQPRQFKPEAASESARLDSMADRPDDLEEARQALADDEALTREMLDQLPEDVRAELEAASADELGAAKTQAERAEQYSKAYRAAAICDLRRT